MVDFTVTDEQKALIQLAKDFVEKEAKPRVAELDKNSDPEKSVSTELLLRCSELGFRQMAIPQKYGGMGIEDTVTIVMVCEELGVGDVTLASVPINGRKLYHILDNPNVTNEMIRDKWLKAFCEDPTFLVSIAMTEPNSGGDNIFPYDAPGSALQTSAVRDGDHFIINGSKQFIAHAGIAKLYMVFTRTDPDKGINDGCTCFLVPDGHPGMTFGRVHDKMGFRLLRNQEIFFEDCRVPESWMLGPENTGMVAIREGLGSDGILNAARAIGVARRAFEEITEFCKNRVQGGKPIIEHQAVATQIADMYAAIRAMRALVWDVAWSADHGTPDPKAVPAAMIYCTEHAFDICHKAAELAGGMGVMKEAPFEKLLRDSFSIKHLDGGNIIKRLKVTQAL